MILIVAGRRASIARPLALAAAAALCVLGLENKVQAILLIGALPLLILPFGSAASPSVAFWRNPRSSWLAAGSLPSRPLAAAWAAWPLIATGFDRALLDAAQFHPLVLGRFGIYQAGADGPDRRLHDRLRRDLARSARPRRWRRCLRWPPAP